MPSNPGSKKCGRKKRHGRCGVLTLSERQWGTVREDYREGGNAWDYLSHDEARSRAYRWGETGWPASAMKGSGCASRCPCGTATIQS